MKIKFRRDGVQIGSEWRKVLARSKSRKIAERVARALAWHHKARMTVTEVDGVWVVFRARNRA